jgi:YesN/AraC family two-component response regulator
MTLIKVILVDDSARFREGLKFFLENILYCQVIAEASNGAEFLNLRNRHQADIIFMDIEMPVLNGIDAVSLVEENAKGNIIAISSFDETHYVEQLNRTGIKGFINKNNMYHELKKVMASVLNGELYTPGNLK